MEDPDRLAQAIEDLAQAIEGNTQEMKALRDAVDDLRTEYQYAVRNSECPYLCEAKVAAEEHPNLKLEMIGELIRISIIEGFAEAIDRVKDLGVKGKPPASDAPEGGHLGDDCECQAAQPEREEISEDGAVKAPQKTFF